MLQRIKNKTASYLWKFNPKILSAKLQGKNIADLQAQGYEYFQSMRAPVFCPWLKDTFFQKAFDQAYIAGFPKEDGAYDSPIINDAFIAGEKKRDVVRRYIAYNLATSTLPIKGDYVECGIHRGMTTHILGYVCDSQYQAERKIWAIDSFEGVSEPNNLDVTIFGTKRWRKHSLKYTNYDHIKKFLSTHKTTVNLIKGWIPDIFPSCDIQHVAFAYIDVDLYEPTKASLEFLYPKLSTGGIIVFDDYGDADCPGSRKAVDEFLVGKENVINLMDGLSFIIKR